MVWCLLRGSFPDPAELDHYRVIGPRGNVQRVNMQQRETDANLLQEWQEALWLLTVLATPLFVNLWVEQQFEASKVWLLRTMVWVLAVLWLGGWMFGHRPKPLPSTIRNLIIALCPRTLALNVPQHLSLYRHLWHT